MKNLVNSIESANNYFKSSESAQMLAIYSDNSRDVYPVIEWLTECVTKKIRKGIAVSVEHLANCSTLQSLMREAVKEAAELGECRQFSIDDRRAVAYRIADEIIENAMCAQELEHYYTDTQRAYARIA